MPKVIIVDDDKDAALALKRNIDGIDSINVVALFYNGNDVVSNYSNYNPDIILMDVRMPGMDGIEASRLIKQIDPSVKILILTLFSEKENVIKAMRNNCDGFINKGHKSEEIISIIKNTCNGFNTYEDKIQTIIHEHVCNSLKQTLMEEDKSTIELLTQRERDIVRLITAGKTNSEISGELFLSEGYVRNQLGVIREKLGLRNSKELAVWGAIHGL